MSQELIKNNTPSQPFILTKNIPREIALSSDKGELKIATLDIGSLDQIYETLNEIVDEEEQIKPPQEVKTIVDTFAANQKTIHNSKGESLQKKHHLLIVGGFVRDILQGKIPNDIDFTTDMPLPEAKKILAELAQVKKTIITGKIPALRVYFDNEEDYEISFFKQAITEDPSASSRPGRDAQARDLTINSLLYNPASGRVIDYVDGLKDIQDKKLRFSGDASERISEDPLRMLRYIRFLFKTGFSVDDDAKKAIKENANRLTLEQYADRIKNEMLKILKIAAADEVLKQLDEFNLLKQILPEVKKLQECEQGPPYHLEGNVYEHTLMVAEKLPPSASIRLKWATIFHDIAKPEARQERKWKNQIRASFINHDKLGVDKTRTILEKMRLDTSQINEIVWLVRNHQILFQQVSGRIIQSEYSDRSREKAKKSIKKMIVEKGDDLVRDLVLLSLADVRGKVSMKEYADSKKTNRLIVEIYQEVKAGLKKDDEDGLNPKRLNQLIDGNEIMQVLDMKAGPQIADVKRTITEKLLALGKPLRDEGLVKKEITKIIAEIKKES